MRWNVTRAINEVPIKVADWVMSEAPYKLQEELRNLMEENGYVELQGKIAQAQSELDAIHKEEVRVKYQQRQIEAIVGDDRIERARRADIFADNHPELDRKTTIRWLRFTILSEKLLSEFESRLAEVDRQIKSKKKEIAEDRRKRAQGARTHDWEPRREKFVDVRPELQTELDKIKDQRAPIEKDVFLLREIVEASKLIEGNQKRIADFDLLLKEFELVRKQINLALAKERRGFSKRLGKNNPGLERQWGADIPSSWNVCTVNRGVAPYQIGFCSSVGWEDGKQGSTLYLGYPSPVVLLPPLPEKAASEDERRSYWQLVWKKAREFAREMEKNRNLEHRKCMEELPSPKAAR